MNKGTKINGVFTVFPSYNIQIRTVEGTKSVNIYVNENYRSVSTKLSVESK